MESGVLTSLSLVFLAAGFTLWFTSLALSRRARRYHSSLQALLKLSGQALEPLDIPAAAWPELQAAGWQGLQWSGDWYGQAIRGELGEAIDNAPRKAATQVFDISSGNDVRLSIGLLHGAPGGEQRLFAIQLARVFVLLLETRVRERTGALSAALAERARLSLYLQHDMRNLTQWVTWVSADFVNAHTEPELLAAAVRLRDNAPLAQERAQRLNAALVKPAAPSVPAEMQVEDALQKAARLAGIELTVHGRAVAWMPPEILARALDNLFSNLALDWREGLTTQPVAELGAHRLVLTCPLPPNGMALAPERLFEPFASGRPGGLGLGLFQARQCLRESGGDLRASLHGDQLQFELLLPQKT